jgi:hypothetical protein
MLFEQWTHILFTVTVILEEDEEQADKKVTFFYESTQSVNSHKNISQ